MVGEHSSKQYDQELEAIRSKVLLMGGMVETQFDDAMNCFRVGNAEQADKVMADDHAVNQLEVPAGRRLQPPDRAPPAGRQRPAHRDGDHQGDHRPRTHRRRGRPRSRAPPRACTSAAWSASTTTKSVRTISRATADMLHDALDAFARLDGKQPRCRSSPRTTSIDHEFRTIMRNLITFMMEDPRTISSALDTLWVAKAIERIGDHAKNIAEYVIYVVEGQATSATRSRPRRQRTEQRRLSDDGGRQHDRPDRRR